MNRNDKNKQQDTKILQHNINIWDKQALQQSPWSQPVSSDIIKAAKQGQWQIHITNA